MTAKRILRWLFACLLAASGAIWWAKRSLRQRKAIVVFMLHRVLDDAQFAQTNSMPGMVVRLRTFEKLVAHCTRYFCVDLASIADEPALRIAYTFDDGWIDTYENAFPVLHGHRAPMTVFVCPPLAGKNAPFWPERAAASMRGMPVPRIESAIEQLKADPTALKLDELTAPLAEIDSTMTWAQILEMDRAGVTFGSHTNTHPILTVVDEAAARTEIVLSQSGIECKLGKPCQLFAYPNGNHSSRLSTMLAQSGYRFAFTTSRGAWTQETDPFTIPRANIIEDHVTGPTGSFSRAMFEYFVFWNSWRATR